MGAGASVDALSLDGELKELLSYYDGNLESAADAVNREIVRVVPKTGSGRFVEVQGAAEGAPFDRSELDRMLELGEGGIRSIFEAQKAALA